MSTKQAKGKQVFVVIFPFDGSICDLPLKTARYGPAKVMPAFGSKPAQVTPGWMFLAPEADSPAAAGVGGGGGSALDSAGGGSVGAPAEGASMDKDLLSLVYSSNCGGSGTTTKLKGAGLYSVGDVKGCSKADLQTLGINIGNANRLIAAVAKKHKR